MLKIPSRQVLRGLGIEHCNHKTNLKAIFLKQTPPLNSLQTISNLNPARSGDSDGVCLFKNVGTLKFSSPRSLFSEFGLLLLLVNFLLRPGQWGHRPQPDANMYKY